MENIRKQFSLDWLSGTDQATASPAADANLSGFADTDLSGLEEAMMFYGGPVVKQLRQSPGTDVGLHGLARELKAEVPDFQFDLLLKVVKYLATKSLVEIVDASDPTGDYRIKLGARAAGG